MTRRLFAASSALLLTLAVGCGKPVEPCPEAEGAFACVEGATLALSSEPWCESKLATAQGLVAEAVKAMELAGQVWDVDPSDYVTGWVISYCGGWFVCGSGGSASWTYGCAELGEDLIKAGPNLDGCASGVLVHEIGHLVVHGDRNHRDPRFAVATALADTVCE